jgi:hypothetical protein
MQFDPLTVIMLAVLGAGALAALAVIATRRKAIMILVGGMLFASAMGAPLDWRGVVMQTSLLSLQQNRSNIYLAVGVAAGLLVLVHATWARGKGIALPAILMLLMAYYAALLRAAHGDPRDALLSLLYATATILPMGLAVKIAIDDLPDFGKVFRALAGVSAFWIFLVGVQFVLDRNDVVTGREMRFIGLTSNPQHAGSFLAVMVAVTLYMAMNDVDRRFRMIGLCLLGINVVLLGWTGSRTALGMGVIGVTGVLYARAGRAILFLPVVALVASVAVKLLAYAGVSAFGFGRLVDTTNTRAEAWSSLLQQGMASPIIGSGIESTNKSENGFLYGFAAYGMGMVFLTVILVSVSGFMCLQLLTKRNQLPRQYRSLADFLIAYIAVYFAGSVFEGYMMARVAANLSFFVIFTSMAAVLIKIADAYGAAEFGGEYDEEYEYEALDYADASSEPA